MKLTFLGLFLFLCSCAHSIHEVHTSDFKPAFPIESGTMINASSEQFVIMGFVTQTQYVDEAYQKLMQQCPSGIISGITTQYSTSMNFFSWTNKILMQGLCVQSRSRTQAQAR